MLRTEIYCHSCKNYIQFDLDTSQNGNHVLKCPKCGHEHCRVVKDGQVTGDRWSSRNQTYQIPFSSMTWSVSVTYASASSSTAYWHAASTTSATGDMWITA